LTVMESFLLEWKAKLQNLLNPPRPRPYPMDPRPRTPQRPSLNLNPSNPRPRPPGQLRSPFQFPKEHK
jgi:hypothetical protein